MKVVFFSLFAVLTLSLEAQNYQIINISGIVKANGKTVQKREVINHDAELYFATKDAFLLVRQLTTRSHFYLTPQEKAITKTNEFLLAVKDALLPPEKFIGTEARPSQQIGQTFKLSTYEELRRFFRGNVLVVDHTFFPVDTNAFPQNQSQFFQLTTTIDQKVQVVKLTSEDGQLIIGPDVLQLPGLTFRMGTLEKVQLAYVDTTKGQEQMLGRFSLTFVPSSYLLEQIQLHRLAFPDLPKKEYIYGKAISLVQQLFGKTNTDTLVRLLDELE